jgi:membrane protein implicated in regulation of membrane protease activity
MEFLDRLSGLLLLAVVLVIVVFLVKEFLWARMAAGLAKVSADDAKPVNTHLIGAVGQVIEPGRGESAARMKVRIGMERWDAELTSGAERALPMGTDVRVVAVRGLVLEVAPALETPDPSTQAPSAGTHPEQQVTTS